MLPALADSEKLLERSIETGQLAVNDYLVARQEILSGRREHLERQLAAREGRGSRSLRRGGRHEVVADCRGARVLIACGGETKHGHGSRRARQGEQPTTTRPSATRRTRRAGRRRLVRIAPEMIRDLRVTTAKAEARAAGERVSVLAELRVNQDAYAEVASPSPARVVRCS